MSNTRIPPPCLTPQPSQPNPDTTGNRYRQRRVHPQGPTAMPAACKTKTRHHRKQYGCVQCICKPRTRAEHWHKTNLGCLVKHCKCGAAMPKTPGPNQTQQLGSGPPRWHPKQHAGTMQANTHARTHTHTHRQIKQHCQNMHLHHANSSIKQHNNDLLAPDQICVKMYQII